MVKISDNLANLSNSAIVTPIYANTGQGVVGRESVMSEKSRIFSLNDSTYVSFFEKTSKLAAVVQEVLLELNVVEKLVVMQLGRFFRWFLACFVLLAAFSIRFHRNTIAFVF